MKENRRDTLRSALGNMRQHSAPDGAWDEIEDQLNSAQSDIEKEPVLQDGLRRMASYRAPARVWAQITDKLDNPYRQLIRWGSAIAASMLILMGLGFWVTRGQPELPPAPVAETRLPDAAHLSPAEEVTYASAWQEQFVAVEACVEEAETSASLYQTPVWRRLKDCVNQLEQGIDPKTADWQSCQVVLDSLQQIYCQESIK